MTGRVHAAPEKHGSAAAALFPSFRKRETARTLAPPFSVQQVSLSPAAARSFNFSAIHIQPTLTINEPGDKYEQEADRVADQVMRMPEGSEVSSPESGVRKEEEAIQAKPLEIAPLIQRQTENLPEEEEKKKEEETIQTKREAGGTSDLAHIEESRINALRGGGQPLSPSLRAFYEPRFGHDFSRVRVHSDAEAAESARVVNAQAFTLGQNIVFGAGRYAPGTEQGRRLIAHELTHTIQQSGPGVKHASPRCRVNESSSQDRKTAVQRGPAFIGSSAAGEGVGGPIFRLPAAPSSLSSTTVTSIPADIQAEIDALLLKTDGKPTEAEVQRLGRLAVSMLGPKGVTSLARKAGVKGADKRDREVESTTEGTIQRQAAEAAGGVAATMWWLTLVDGPLPIGDIIYGALILGAAITAAAAADAIRRSCSEKLTACLENPWQPDWNRGDFGPRKDCGACYRECVLAAGVWPDYKCPR